MILFKLKSSCLNNSFINSLINNIEFGIIISLLFSIIGSLFTLNISSCVIYSTISSIVLFTSIFSIIDSIFLHNAQEPVKAPSHRTHTLLPSHPDFGGSLNE